ncbi:MAG: glycosyltransferase [Bacteroidetes bacterium]|nr:glycosyltransferase [Bacteroidota bacterium]
MRLFVLLSRVPYPLEKGDKLRAFHQVVQLSKKNEIVLCALNPNRKLNKRDAFSALQPYCRSINFIDIPITGRVWNIFKAFLKGLPLQVGYFYSCKAARKVNKLIEEYKPDHIYCQLLRTAEYVKKSTIPKTIDYQDVFSYGVKRRMEKAPFYTKPVFRMEYKRLLKYETNIFDIFDHKTIISIPDRDLIPHPEKGKIHVIPNGVDHDFFSPRNSVKKVDLVFTGNMAYPPNVDAAEFLVNEIMPLVWKEKPGAKVMIAGATPDKRVTSLKSEKVIVTGWLDDIRDSYAGAKVFIAPMQIGTGLQNKLLEAMSMKVPSITTPLANDALQAVDGESILIGKDASSLAQHILNLLNDEALYQKIADNGFTFVKQHYSWEEATDKLNNILHKN